MSIIKYTERLNDVKAFTFKNEFKKNYIKRARNFISNKITQTKNYKLKKLIPKPAAASIN